MNESDTKPWYVYMIRCEDSSLYTGITTDINRRFREHKEGRGAKYTRVKKPVEIAAFFSLNNRSEASRLEYFIKKLSRKEKEFLILTEKNKKDFVKEAEIRLKIKIKF